MAEAECISKHLKREGGKTFMKFKRQNPNRVMSWDGNEAQMELNMEQRREGDHGIQQVSDGIRMETDGVVE